MGGTSTQQQQQSQQSQLTPWAPAGNQLQGILGQLPTNIGATPDISNAFGSLIGAAGQPNALGPAAIGAATSQLGGAGNYGNATGILNSAYGDTRSALSPYTSGNAMDPNSNPALARALATVNTDVTNSVNPMFAAAGRLGSPDNYQALARGITQGSTGILQNAAQNQLGAIGALQGAAGGTAGGLLGADVANSGIQSQGIGNAGNAFGANLQGPQAVLGALLGQQQLPIQNASALTGILGPLAGMFGQQTGSSNTTGSQTLSPAAQAWGWINSFANLGSALKPGGGKTA